MFLNIAESGTQKFILFFWFDEILISKFLYINKNRISLKLENDCIN